MLMAVSRAMTLRKVETVAGRLATIETQRDAAVAEAIAEGCTWAEIGAALGVSAQAAHRRFRWLRHSRKTGEVWREPPLPV
jgi:DNA-binding NarL/FixJ family response regulator